MSEPKNLAERLFDTIYAESAVLAELWDRWPDHVSHIGYDHYDCSLEIYFTRETPADFRFSEDDAALVYGMGFAGCYLNFADGTEQVMSQSHGLRERKAVEHPRWHEETQDHWYRLARAEKREAQLRTALAAAEAERDSLLVSVADLVFCEQCGGSADKMPETNAYPPRYCHVCSDAMMAELAALRARLDAAEAVARACIGLQVVLLITDRYSVMPVRDVTDAWDIVVDLIEPLEAELGEAVRAYRERDGGEEKK